MAVRRENDAQLAIIDEPRDLIRQHARDAETVQATAGVPSIDMNRFVGGERPVPPNLFH